ncbi:malonyl-CoA:anthocyanidin 5-O-glucoside-6''-O-malonyltransferase-like isoform X2 [Euphorbia lathyris]|uniref:malonyl-CoA:anthocyanidin 5-O-glucoside-6''-O-malonyltransferase-like isoform X2 n=1 Tax=Euphorbia lathyris TaxID=212925 RepID=UPI003314347C
MAISYNYSLKMLEVCRVTPFTNSVAPLVEFSLPLTYFDIRWLKFLPAQQIFSYQLTENESTHSFFNSVILPRLKHSLSLALSQFLPIVGNIIWPVDTVKPFILYTPNDDVSLIVAESNSEFNHLLKEAVELHPYVPDLAISDAKAAIIAFQITFFPSQGFSIGISQHRTMFDGKSNAMFMKSWAHICNSDMTTLLPLDLTPSFDRTSIDYPQEFDMLHLNNWVKSNSDQNPNSLNLLGDKRNFENLVRANFELSRQDIDKLRQQIVALLNEEEDANANHMHSSTFVLSLAYIVVCIVNAKMLEEKGKICLTFGVDCRSCFDRPLPTNYFGNCIIECPMLIDAEAITGSGEARKESYTPHRMDFDEEGLERPSVHYLPPPLNEIAFVAKRISERIKEIETRVTNISIEDEKENILEMKKAKESSDVFIGVSWCPQFEIYRTDFGWGKPKKIQDVSIDTSGEISMIESRNDNGGIEIGLVLRKHEMEMFNSVFINGITD